MSSKSKSTPVELDNILNFVDASQGLRAKINESGRVQILQELDSKVFSFNSGDVSEVLHRSDSEGKPFIQVNFKSGAKVLLTETLVGFKPADTFGLDMNRIPRVVTTPDLTSVYEAIEEAMAGDQGVDHEVEILKKVYLAIITGGEAAGFDLCTERGLFNRLIASKLRASA